MKNYRINGEIVGGVSKSRIDKIVHYIDLSKVKNSGYDNGNIKIDFKSDTFLVSSKECNSNISITNYEYNNIRIVDVGKDAKISITGDTNKIIIDDDVHLDKLLIEKCKELRVDGYKEQYTTINSLCVKGINELSIYSSYIKNIEIKSNNIQIVMEMSVVNGTMSINSNNNIKLDIEKSYICNMKLCAEQTVGINSKKVQTIVMDTYIKAKDVLLYLDKTFTKRGEEYKIDTYTIVKELLLLDREDLDKIEEVKSMYVESDELYIDDLGWIERLKTNANINTNSFHIGDNGEIKLDNTIFSCMLGKYKNSRVINGGGYPIIICNNDTIEVDELIEATIRVERGICDYKLYIKNDIHYNIEDYNLEEIIPRSLSGIYVNSESMAHKKLATENFPVNIYGYDKNSEISKLDRKMKMLGISEEDTVIKLIESVLDGNVDEKKVDINILGQDIKISEFGANYIGLVKSVGVRVDKKLGLRRYAIKVVDIITEEQISIQKIVYSDNIAIDLIVGDMRERWFIGCVEMRRGYEPLKSDVKLKILSKLDTVGGKDCGNINTLKNSLYYRNNKKFQRLVREFYHSLTGINCYIRRRGYITLIYLGEFIYLDEMHRIIYDKNIIKSKLKAIKNSISSDYKFCVEMGEIK